MNQNNCLLTAWIRFSLTAEVQPQAGLNLAPSDTAPRLVGWICPAWNLKNRLFLVLSSLWCLLRIWPFERSVSWCTRESCRWVGIQAKSSNTSQPCSYLKEQHLLICSGLTGCHFAMAATCHFLCCTVTPFCVRLFCWDQKLMLDLSSQFCI